MSLHPEIAKIIAQIPEPDGSPLDPEAMRAAEAGQVAPLEERLPLHEVRDQSVPTEAGDVPVRVYDPTGTPGRGVIVYLHGGAFFLGSLDTEDHVCRELAAATGMAVVSVGYRLAPEHAFPAGLDDCWAVLRSISEMRDELGWDGKTLALAGPSSGGNFVAALVARAKDEGFVAITHQVLYYPSLDLDFDEERYFSLRENATGYGLETAGLKPFNSFYTANGADPTDPAVSPIKREDLTGLPPALVVTAEFDPLRDEAELYARRLREAGVDVVHTHYEGANHGFVQNFSWIPEFHRVFEETARFLREH